jgi:hypothetical protein
MSVPSTPTPPGGPLRGPAALSGPSAGAARRADRATDGAAFKALLERLEQRAGALEERSRVELSPEELPEAVDEARASMQEALRLSSELLEAWRQARHSDDAATPGSRS